MDNFDYMPKTARIFKKYSELGYNKLQIEEIEICLDRNLDIEK